MKIRCIGNTGAFLPENYLDQKRGYTKELKLPLTIGKEYVVYAIYERQQQVWYYIADDNFMYYPMRTPAPLFEVVDNRISKYWRFDLRPNGLLRLAVLRWLNDPHFYEKLTDQEAAEVDLFKRIKAFMDIEAETPPEVTETAEKELATTPV
ncbi:MAG: hypothetical protein F6K40_37285 [Okeania sp. SIO3I5]|uniref:hypothetical protein n=1 Tax=Okeania sp. SIO3I5 TaxID=2607805 RepID=UPI0013BCE2AC|nr:hypothetical protein [Okeania sp. SIO3I5]NEQ41548.1 hypothetical protein [Okeania sp. SIO3I5]